MSLVSENAPVCTSSRGAFPFEDERGKSESESGSRFDAFSMQGPGSVRYGSFACSGVPLSTAAGNVAAQASYDALVANGLLMRWGPHPGGVLGKVGVSFLATSQSSRLDLTAKALDISDE